MRKYSVKESVTNIILCRGLGLAVGVLVDHNQLQGTTAQAIPPTMQLHHYSHTDAILSYHPYHPTPWNVYINIFLDKNTPTFTKLNW